MNARARGVSFVGAVLCGGLVLVACGGSSDSTPSATPPAPTVTVTATVSAPATVTIPPPATPDIQFPGFPEGLSYWTTDGGEFAAFSRRSGSAMCLAVLYPESRPDVGTVTDTPTEQLFQIEAKAGGVLFDPEPAQTASVTGDPATGLTLAYSSGNVRQLAPSSEAAAAAILAAQYPSSDGTQLLQNNLSACP